MSVEDVVRQKHAFQRALKEYLAFVSVMTHEEVELALGRLADMLNSSDNSAERFHISIKGTILKMYLDLRVAGIKKQSTVKRLALRPAMKRFFAERGKSEHQTAVQRYREAVAAYEERRAKWQAQVKQLPLLKRIFSAPTPPPFPNLPATVETFVKKAKEKAEIPEFVIATAAGFRLLAVPPRIEDVNSDEIKLLAP